MKPHFSVIVPVFNAAQTIAQTVHTILIQTERDFELLLIDDGSSDDSVKIMLQLAAEDDRIRVLSHPNEGVSATRNLGVALARGQLLAFCDADDCWHPAKLARHRALHAARPDLGASFAQIAFLEHDQDAFTRTRTISTVPPGDLGVAALIADNPVCTASNLVVTASCFKRVGPFKPAMGFAEDQEWLTRCAATGERITGIDALLVDYRMSPAGLSSNLTRMYAGWRRLALTYRDHIDLAQAEAIYCRYLSRRALRSGGSAGTALGYAWRGLRLSAPAFFGDARRGGMTLAGAILSIFVPQRLRARVFA